MATTTTTSKQFTINISDVWKGLIMAVILPVLTTIYTSLEAGALDFDWKKIGVTAGLGFVGYIIKNFFTPSAIVIKDVPKETVEAVKEGDAKVTVTHE